MNTEYRKMLLESLQTVHQTIDDAEPAQLPGLIHAEIEIINTMEKADQVARVNKNLNNLVSEVFSGSKTKLQTNVDNLFDKVQKNLGGE